MAILPDQKVILESMSVDPFNDWSDWYGTNGETVVTFVTMKQNLWNSWKNQCISIEGDLELVENSEGTYSLEGETEKEIRPEKFDSDKVQEPGIYRDRAHEGDDDKVEEAYTVIVPKEFLTPELCEKYMEKLNESFYRNFELNIEPYQKRPVSTLKKIKHRFDRENEEIASKLEDIISELKD
jgi:hypothetical protein